MACTCTLIAGTVVMIYKRKIYLYCSCWEIKITLKQTHYLLCHHAIFFPLDI